MEIITQIAQWKSELIQPRMDDVLVALMGNKNAYFFDEITTEDKLFFPAENSVRKIANTAKSNEKINGSYTCGFSDGVLEFEMDETKITAPVFIQSGTLKLQSWKNQFEFTKIGDVFLNPWLSKKLPFLEGLRNKEQIVAALETHFQSAEWKECFALANFHPHRFFLLKELEDLELKEGINELFTSKEKIPLQLPYGEIFPLDKDQKKTLSLLNEENVCLQGPPGTGKSYVIATLLGKLLANKNRAALVADKKTALQVVYNLLKKHELHHFALLNHHQEKAITVMESLKSSWLFLEHYLPKKKPYIGNHQNILHQLELLISKLTQKNTIGGLSFAEFRKKYTLEEIVPSLPKNAKIPSLVQWENDLPHLKHLLKNEQLETALHLKSCRDLTAFSKMLEEAVSLQEQILKNDFFDITWTKNDIAVQMKRSGLSRLFFYQGRLLPKAFLTIGSNKQKKLIALANELQFVRAQIEQLQEEKKLWKKDFSLSELNEYILALSTTNRFNIGSWLKKRELLQYAHLDFALAKEALEQLVKLKSLEKKELELIHQLQQWEIPSQSHELVHLNFLIQQLNAFPKNEVKSLSSLSEEELYTLQNADILLQRINSFVIKHLIISDNEPFYAVLTKIIENSDDLTKSFSEWNGIGEESKQLLQFKKDLNTIQKGIIHHHWSLFVGQHPVFKANSIGLLNEKIKAVIEERNNDAHAFSSHIIDGLKQQFDYYHQMLQTPAQQLSKSEKELKKQLRKGKSILVREFAKSKQHKTLLELFQSEAKAWIVLLKPLFLVSPSSLANNFPVEKDFFDVAIIDEASQMPLYSSLGTVFRGKRMLVAGDEQQMPPSSFSFSVSDKTTILQQTQFYYASCSLSFHYRSEHPDLITFSNQYFYRNQLKAFPSLNAQDSIEFILLEGQFEQRVNEKEARYIAQLISQKLDKNEHDFGLVAFSQVQLYEIIKHLPEKAKQQLQEIEDNVLVQSLEYLQGEECNHLFVSLGYAKNEEGKVRLQFGALNHSGGHKRLNVLMSRAKKKITFVSSLKSEDLPISDNEGVDMLRKLLYFLEENKKGQSNFPLGLQPVINDNMLTFEQVYVAVPDASTLITLYHVLTTRGWKVDFRL